MEAHEGLTHEEFEEILKLAEAGDAEEQLNAGTALRHGWGVEQNGQEALEWFKKAAANGNAGAALAAGTMYFVGDSGERDLEKAHSWYNRALQLGPVPVLPLVNELYIAQALERDDIRQANEQLKVRDSALDHQPMLYPGIYIWNVISAFCHVLQNLVARELPKGVVPGHSDERLKETNLNTLWYEIKTDNPEIFRLIFEYVKKNDDPPFWAISFYGPKQEIDHEEAEEILERLHGDHRFKNLQNTWCVAYLQDMSLDDMLVEKQIQALAGEIGKLYKTARKVAAAMASARARD